MVLSVVFWKENRMKRLFGLVLVGCFAFVSTGCVREWVEENLPVHVHEAPSDSVGDLLDQVVNFDW